MQMVEAEREREITHHRRLLDPILQIEWVAKYTHRLPTVVKCYRLSHAIVTQGVILAGAAWQTAGLPTHEVLSGRVSCFSTVVYTPTLTLDPMCVCACT